MKTIYLVAPLVMLTAFAGYVVPAKARLDATLTAQRAADEQRLDAERREHDEQLAIARAENEHRVAARQHEQAERERRAREAQAARDNALRDELDHAQATRETLRREIATLDARLRDLTVERDRANAGWFAARHALETMRIERRAVDLELQRSTHVLAEHVEAGCLDNAPVFPSPDRPGSS